jgi:O-antigen/teichoic acid export membrane protein
MAASVASAVFGFLFWTAAARLYPASEVGIAAATVSAVGLMAVLAALGLDYALVRFLPHAADPHGLVNSSLTVGAVAGGLAALIFLAGLDAWSPALVRFRANLVFDAAVVMSVVGTVIMGLLGSVYLSRLRAAYALVQSIIFGTVKVALAVIFALTQGAVGLLGAWALGSSLAWLAGALVILPRIEGGRYRPRPTLRRGVINDMAHFAFPNYLASLFWSTPALILPLLVVNIVGPEAGAYFYVAASVGGLVAMIPTAVSMSLFAQGSHDTSELVGRALVSARFALTLLVPAIAGVFLLGAKVLLIFGRAYSEQGTRLLWVLALATLPLTVNLLFLSVRRVQQRMGGVVAATAWFLVATLVLSALLLPRFGLVGVGVAWFAAQASTAAVVLTRYLLNRKQPDESTGLLR